MAQRRVNKDHGFRVVSCHSGDKKAARKSIAFHSQTFVFFLVRENINKLSNLELEIFTDSYWDAESNYMRKIYVKEDTLRYFRSEQAISPLVPIAENEFQMLGVEANLKVKFEKNKESEKEMLITINNNNPLIFEAINDPIRDTLKIMQEYSGKYYSPELQTTYFNYMQDGQLKSHHPRHGDYSMNILKKDVLSGEYPLNTLKMIRDEKGEIAGFCVSNNRVRNLWFEKQ